MNIDVLKTLQELKRIEPDATYVKHSRMLILAAPQIAPSVPAQSLKLSTFLRLSTILGAGIASIFFILGGISYINETYSPLALDGLNQKSLVAEADEINNSIEITLGAIDYLDTSNQATLKKIAEISKSSGTETTAPMLMSTAGPAATSTDVQAFLIKSDPTTEPAESKQASDNINAILEKVSE